LSDLQYAVSGFGVGALVGMTGIGGGSLMTPLLILVFGAAPTTAVGTDLLFAASTKTIGTIVHAGTRTIDWMLVRLLALGSVPSAIATLLLLSQFDLKGDAAQHVIRMILGSVLILTAAFLIAGRRIRARQVNLLVKLDRRTTTSLTIGLGALMGVLVTATSVGAGAIGVTVLLMLHPTLPANRVVGSDIAHAVPLTLFAGAGHWYLGSIDWHLLAALLIGSLPGVIAGSLFAQQVPDIVIRTAMAVVLVFAGARLLG
jgi:uncharacterized protein